MFTVKMKRWVNFILMCCILFSGISFERDRADSFVSHTVKEEAHTLETAEVLSINRDICTNELIGARVRSVTSLQAARVGGRRISGRIVLAHAVQVAQSELSVGISEVRMEQVEIENICGNAVIVSYIHNKDGKKA